MSYRSKIVDLKDALPILKELKEAHVKIVFTNGCFDLLHEGHIHYLEKSRELGDFLIVGLNSDASVSRLKGSGRPVKKVDNRSAVLAGLTSVDMVVVFEEDTPFKLIRAIVPDVLVKGGDYKKEEIVGADLVERSGGSVEVVQFLEGKSSTSIIEKMEGNKDE